jgi:8-oxo-dGTP pyrophosphatase MutT (NUDIX family)
MDDASSLFPISVKGVVVRKGAVLLLKNRRDEWDLPGGRLEPDETPEGCVARETKEETQLLVTVGSILASGVVCIKTTRKVVFVVIYGCHPSDRGEPVLSAEHVSCGWFTKDDVARMDIRPVFRRSIDAWWASSKRGH